MGKLERRLAGVVLGGALIGGIAHECRDQDSHKPKIVKIGKDDKTRAETGSESGIIRRNLSGEGDLPMSDADRQREAEQGDFKDKAMDSLTEGLPNYRVYTVTATDRGQEGNRMKQVHDNFIGIADDDGDIGLVYPDERNNTLTFSFCDELNSHLQNIFDNWEGVDLVVTKDSVQAIADDAAELRDMADEYNQALTQGDPEAAAGIKSDMVDILDHSSYSQKEKEDTGS